MGIRAEPEMSRVHSVILEARTEETNTALSQESGMIEEFDDTKRCIDEGVVSKRLAKEGISCSVTEDAFSVKANMENMIAVFDNIFINT